MKRFSLVYKWRKFIDTINFKDKVLILIKLDIWTKNKNLFNYDFYGF